MTIQHVYRVQDKNGRGPFKPGFTIKWNEGREDMVNLEPFYCQFPSFNPARDIARNEFCGCACRTIDQLKRWFTKIEYERLKKFGYKAVRLSVERVLHESDIQLIFARRKRLNKETTAITLYE